MRTPAVQGVVAPPKGVRQGVLAALLGASAPQARPARLESVGLVKRMWMEAEERGWNSSDEFVCPACVDDYALEAAIREGSADDQMCSFCGASPAAEIDVLTAAFVDGLWREHEDALEGVSYDSAEGGYIFLGDNWDTWDLVEHYGDVFVGDGLVERMQELIHDRTWVERDFAWRRRDAALRDAWGAFTHAVKHRTRYVIWIMADETESDRRSEGEVPPGKILYDIANILDELGLIQEIAAGAAFWRAQTHAGPHLSGGATAGRLGTAPIAYAKQPNRMSPAGIPMFYGAEDQATAVAEVTRHMPVGKDHWTMGMFRAPAALTVVDFTSLRPVSMFDPERGHLHRQAAFLQEFVSELSRPIAPGDEHIEYVPTQIMTEFFLRVYETAGSGRPRIDGIRYPSAARPGGVSVVLDVPHERCVDTAPVAGAAGSPFLVLDLSSVETSKSSP